jgi:hypothetical protein
LHGGDDGDDDDDNDDGDDDDGDDDDDGGNAHISDADCMALMMAHKYLMTA